MGHHRDTENLALYRDSGLCLSHLVWLQSPFVVVVLLANVGECSMQNAPGGVIHFWLSACILLCDGRQDKVQMRRKNIECVPGRELW